MNRSFIHHILVILTTCMASVVIDSFGFRISYCNGDKERMEAQVHGPLTRMQGMPEKKLKYAAYVNDMMALFTIGVNPIGLVVAKELGFDMHSYDGAPFLLGPILITVKGDGPLSDGQITYIHGLFDKFYAKSEWVPRMVTKKI